MTYSWEDYDLDWFRERPHRNYRLRRPYNNDADVPLPPSGYDTLVLVHRDRFDERLRSRYVFWSKTAGFPADDSNPLGDADLRDVFLLPQTTPKVTDWANAAEELNGR